MELVEDRRNCGAGLADNLRAARARFPSKRGYRVVTALATGCIRMIESGVLSQDGFTVALVAYLNSPGDKISFYACIPGNATVHLYVIPIHVLLYIQGTSSAEILFRLSDYQVD